MPNINPTNRPRTLREMRSAELAQALQAQREALHSTTWINTPYDIYQMEVTKRTAASRLKEQDTIEVEALKDFMRTGWSRNVYGKDGAIFMVGEDRKPTHILFAMDKTTIRTHKTRVKHLKPLLEELAEREGLKLELSTKVPEVGPDNRQVTYYAFKRFKVDDTELVTAARPRDWRGDSENYESCDNCGHCGEPECVNCSHCDECRPDDEYEAEDDDDEDDDDGFPF